MAAIRWFSALGALLVVLGCGADEAPGPAATELAAWDPIDAQFAGCAGACGAHAQGAEPGVIEQPAEIGQRTYCPVSGAVFAIEASHPHRDLDGDTLYFCCEGCAQYFDENRAAVLRARGLQPRARTARR